MNKFTFIDLFSGIGGFYLALSNNGGKCINYCEINSNAIETYCENHNESPNNNLGDIKKLTSIPNHDILTAGVPCQSWSIAGKNLGFDDDRGQLWNDTIYLLKQSQPKAFIFENVKGLVDPRNKKEFAYIMDRIKLAGYYAKHFIINSLDYGLPQNRIRVYIIGFKVKKYLDNLIIPNSINHSINLGDIIDIKTPHEKKSRNNKTMSLSSKNGFNDYFLFNDLRNGDTTIHSWDIISTTDREKEICLLLLKNRRKKKYGKLDGNPLSLSDIKELDNSITRNELSELVDLEILKEIYFEYYDDIKYEFKNSKISTGLFGINRIFLPTSNVFSTLVASDTNDYVTDVMLDKKTKEQYKKDFIDKVYNKNRYRKITKKEACMIQGFPKNFDLPESRSKWMKLIGNSVSVPVVDVLIKSIIKTNILKNE